MRLLNTKTLEFQEFWDSSIPGYIILSHTWGKDECTMNSFTMLKHADRKPAGVQKVLDFCNLARSGGFQWEWVWVDTCCIDKTSSAELSEAINSMYRWYQQARECWVYLYDVKMPAEGILGNDGTIQMRNSRWFTRGWTLQELLAPAKVNFFDQAWKHIGTLTKTTHSFLSGEILVDIAVAFPQNMESLGPNEDLSQLIADITGIPQLYLEGSNIQRASVAERMSWAARRQTSRLEDRAYSLLGLFDVNLPLIYGEGKKAFRRLQKEILSEIDDETILAWWPDVDNPAQYGLGVLAESPDDFLHSSGLYVDLSKIPRPPPIPTSRGLQMHVDVQEYPAQRDLGESGHVFSDAALIPDIIHLRLNCHHPQGFLVQIPVRRYGSKGSNVFYRRGGSKWAKPHIENAELELQGKKSLRLTKQPIYLRL